MASLDLTKTIDPSTRPTARGARSVEKTAADHASLRELRGAELRAERLSAAIRVVVLLSLAAVFLTIKVNQPHNTYVAWSMAIYGVVTVIAAVLAWQRIVHVVLAYTLVTIDVLLVAAQLTLLVRVFALPHAMAYSVPAVGLIYLVLAHATLRFRPLLVVYAAVLFVAALEGSRLFLHDISHAGTMSPEEANPFVYGHAFPLSLIALTALSLWAAGSETRRMLRRAIAHAGRAANLSRFFSPAVASRLAELETPQAVRGDRRYVAILFVDIHGFSMLGKQLAPDELAALMTEFRDVVTKPVFETRGAIDKFVGDGALIVFGSPERSADDAARAVQCGRLILEQVAAWSTKRAAAGQAPVRVGVGGHWGEVFAGVLGRAHQLEFTVIGDAVNIAERIERLTRHDYGRMVISADLLDAAGERSDGRWRPLPDQPLPAHGTRLDLFGLR